MAKEGVWNKDVPVEKSSYLCDENVTFYNLDDFLLEDDKFRMIDLFCGAGGFAVGCSWAGFQSVFGNDHLEPAMETWVHNHPHSIGCLGDINRIDAHEIRTLLENKGVNHIHLITGGVPCQGFSIANRKHNDNDERNFLFLQYMRFVEVFAPDYLILENVSGMRSTAGGKFENDIKEYMGNLNYDVSVKLLCAADFGVPQIRQRLIFVGVHRDRNLPPFIFPENVHVGEYRTVHDAISDLPALDSRESKEEYELEPLNEYQELMRGYGGIEGIYVPKKLFNHEAPNHDAETIIKIANTQQGQPMYDRFKQRIRLDNNKPSPTQLAGGIRPQFQFGHPTQNRGLSIRERARIQSFPDCYKFCGGIVQERVQTGNAVPPLMVYYLALQIADGLRNRGEE